MCGSIAAWVYVTPVCSFVSYQGRRGAQNISSDTAFNLRHDEEVPPSSPRVKKQGWTATTFNVSRVALGRVARTGIFPRMPRMSKKALGKGGFEEACEAGTPELSSASEDEVRWEKGSAPGIGAGL